MGSGQSKDDGDDKGNGKGLWSKLSFGSVRGLSLLIRKTPEGYGDASLYNADHKNDVGEEGNA